MHRTLARTDFSTALLVAVLTALAALAGYFFSQQALLLLPVLGGFGLTLYAGVRLWHIYRSPHWVATDASLVRGVLVSREVATSVVTRRTYWYPAVTFRYTYQGNTFTGERIALDLKSVWDEDREQAQKLLDRLGKARLNVYVNPRRPRLAVMFYGATPERISHYWALALGGTLISATAVIVLAMLPG